MKTALICTTIILFQLTFLCHAEQSVVCGDYEFRCFIEFNAPDNITAVEVTGLKVIDGVEVEALWYEAHVPYNVTKCYGEWRPRSWWPFTKWNRHYLNHTSILWIPGGSGKQTQWTRVQKVTEPIVFGSGLPTLIIDYIHQNASITYFVTSASHNRGTTVASLH